MSGGGGGGGVGNSGVMCSVAVGGGSVVVVQGFSGKSTFFLSIKLTTEPKRCSLITTPRSSPPTMNCARSLAVQALRPTISTPGAVARSITSRGLRTRDVKPVQTDTEGSPNEQRAFRTIETMPFQTYQLALDVIRKDRLERLEEIKKEQQRIAGHLASGFKPDSREIKSMNKHLEWLRVQADINNPRVKYNFDRGHCMMPPPPGLRRGWVGLIALIFRPDEQARLQVLGEPKMESIPTANLDAEVGADGCYP
jgi:hypothetical protein